MERFQPYGESGQKKIFNATRQPTTIGFSEAYLRGQLFPEGRPFLLIGYTVPGYFDPILPQSVPRFGVFWVDFVTAYYTYILYHARPQLNDSCTNPTDSIGTIYGTPIGVKAKKCLFIL